MQCPSAFGLFTKCTAIKIIDSVSQLQKLFNFQHSGPCLDVLVPHDEVVNLGIVSEGSYQVVQSNGIPLGRLNVKAATKNTPDDYLYAPISQAYVRNQNGQVALTLSGTFTNSCMRLQKIISNVQGNVVTVQPIAALTAAGGCTPRSIPIRANRCAYASPTGTLPFTRAIFKW